jgi:exodeoxyribonuclease VII large subunit
MNADFTLSVSDFVALLNQTLETAYPYVTISGELANFRVSKNRWVYFDLKDEPVGEGAIKRAAELLQLKLQAEGLFDPSRKRALPYPPTRIGLVASKESAAYVDFIKVLGARWSGLDITLIDVQVQGEPAPAQIVAAIAQLNQLAEPPEVLVITRGGGSAEDMAAFSSEQVTRAVASSRIPTLVAIGHERDVCLAELAADQRASTPSNAAELLVPDRMQVLSDLSRLQRQLGNELRRVISEDKAGYDQALKQLQRGITELLQREAAALQRQRKLLEVLHPASALKRGYALIRHEAKLVRSVRDLPIGSAVELELSDGRAQALIKEIHYGKI